MASKRDQLQAHQFLFHRAISALVARETDPEQPPMRRPGTAAFASIGVAVLALAATGVYGVISPGGDKSWQDGKSVIVERETGTRYVYLDGKLDPVVNYASALLALGDHADALAVSANSLLGVPRGPRIGIPDAPDALAGPDRLLSGAWTLCSAPGTDATGAAVERSALLIGTEAGGAPLGDRAVLAQVPELGQDFLVYGGFRHQVSQSDTVAVGLAMGSAPLVRVDPAVMDMVPDGAPIGPIPLPDAGKPSTAVPGRKDLRVGQLLMMTASGGTQHYLVEADRIRPISELAYDIQLAYQPTTAAYPDAEPFAMPLSPIDAAAARQDPPSKPTAGDLPTTRPAFAPAGTLCLAFHPGTTVPRVTVDPKLPTDGIIATPQRTDGGVPLADQIMVPAGRGAVVQSMPTGTYAVITDLGRIYPVANAEVLGTRGYAGVTPVKMPASLLARLPEGPGLAHDTAMRQS